VEEISTRINTAAKKFLATGRVNGVDSAELAVACSNLIRKQSETSLTKALSSAKKFANFSKTQDKETLCTALRALARVSHLISRYDDAEKAYLAARALAKNRLAELATIDRALVDLYMYTGDFAESRRRAKMAIAGYSKLGATADVAKTTVNYANLLHRQDKHREAEKLYHKAADYFEKLNDELSIARCYYNRANALVQLFELDQAESLYIKSNEIYHRHGHSIDANDAMYGLAWLRMLKGEYHVALIDLTECERVFKDAGHPRMAALCELDRAEVFLNLNLFSDAWESSTRAETVFNKLKIRYESSKAAFYRAKSAFALLNKIEASRSLKRAIRGFTQEKNDGFLAAALLLNSQLVISKRQRQSFITNARKKFAYSQLPLWEAICNIHLGSKNTFRTDALKRLQKNSAVHHVPHLYAQWQTLKGDEAESSGNIGKAINYWRTAANTLDRVRAQLPPVELRTNFGCSDLSPHRRLIQAESQNRPLNAAVWSEKFKTAGVWSPLENLNQSTDERAKVEQSLIDLANRVSSYAHQIKGMAGERGNLAPQSRSTFSDLQKRVRQELAAIEKQSQNIVEKPDNLLEIFRHESHAQPIVQFHVGQDDIFGFVHWRGTAILRKYPEGRQKLTKFLQQWRFLLEHELLQKHLGSASRTDDEHKLFEKIGDWLWQPLEIPKEAKRVLVLPEGELANIPWQALRINRRPLAEKHSFVLAPSLRHFVHAKRIKVSSNEVSLFVGVSDDLPQVRRELEVLSQLSEGKVNIMNPSRRNDWPGNKSAKLWHYSGHAFLRSDNPFYSYLALADGPLFAADFRLKNSQVELVTLAACRSGEQVALSGEETTGLVRSLLEMGARNVIAGLWPVADESTGYWMNEFYSGYFGKENIGNAAARASLKTMEKYPSAYHWAAFSIFGAGDRAIEYN